MYFFLKYKFKFIQWYYDVSFLGCWANNIWLTPYNLKVQELKPKGNYQNNLKVIKYLKQGIIFKKHAVRTFSWKITSGDYLFGTPSLYTDGTFVWNKEYIFYIEKGMLVLNKKIEKHAIQNAYKIPVKEDIDLKKIKSLAMLI